MKRYDLGASAREQVWIGTWQRGCARMQKSNEGVRVEVRDRVWDHVLSLQAEWVERKVNDATGLSKRLIW